MNIVASGELVSSGFRGCLTAPDSGLLVVPSAGPGPSTSVVNMHLSVVGRRS